MSIEYGCLFCQPDHERNVINYLQHIHPDIEAISPTKVRYRRQGGIAVLEKVKLFPNYVFFAANSGSLNSFFLCVNPGIIKILTCGGNGRWQLYGADREFVERLFRVGGEIGLSTAYYEGDRIRIESGFLKEYEGSIIAVNHRAKTARIKMTIADKVFDLWLGFEEISKSE